MAVGLQVVELVAVVPGAELIIAGQRTVGVRLPVRARTIGILQFGDRQSPNVEREAHAIRIARRRVGRIPRDRAPVEDAPEHGDAVGQLRPSANAQARQRIGGAAGGQICCWQRRKTGDAVDEEGVGGRADDEFLIEALLADLDVEFVAEFLLIPELPKPNADGRLDVAQGLQDQEIVRGQVSAPILEAAHVQRAALETERLLGVHLQRDGGQPVRFETLFDAARQVAERLDVLEDRELNAVLVQGGPEPAHVAKQVLALHVQSQTDPASRQRSAAPRRPRGTASRRAAAGRRERDWAGAKGPQARLRGPALAGLVSMRWGRRRAQGRDRVGEGGAGEAGEDKSGGVPERGPAATDWTMKGAQPKLQVTCRTAMVDDFDPARVAMSIDPAAR